MKPGTTSLPPSSTTRVEDEIEARDLVVGADRDDLGAADRDRLRLRPRVVHGDDLAAAQHQIGRRLRARRRRGEDEESADAECRRNPTAQHRDETPRGSTHLPARL